LIKVIANAVNKRRRYVVSNQLCTLCILSELCVLN